MPVKECFGSIFGKDFGEEIDRVMCYTCPATIKCAEVSKVAIIDTTIGIQLEAIKAALLEAHIGKP